MLIATWNINGLGARFDFLAHWLKARQPDVVGLQELKATADHFPRQALEELGYHAAVCGQKAWNGVAVLSRHEVEEVQSGLPGEEEAGARLMRVRTAGLDFTTVYCPNGKDIDHLDFPRKLAWFDSLRDYLAGFAAAGRAGGSVRRLQHRADPPRHPRRGAAGGRHPPHGSRAGAVRGTARSRVRRPVPGTPSGHGQVLVVGLPLRRLPPEPWPADRLPAGHRSGPGPSGTRRDRPGLPQEEGRPDRVGPRAGDGSAVVVARFAAPEVTGESPLLSGRGWVVVARIVEVQHAIDLLAAHGRSTRGAAVPLAVALALTFAALVQPGSQAVAQAVEVEDREEGPKKRTGASRPTPPEGQVYTWKDGGRSSRAFLQADLVVSREGAVSAVGTPVARTPQGRIVRVASASEVEGQPVFRSSSGALMTLPGVSCWSSIRIGAKPRRTLSSRRMASRRTGSRRSAPFRTASSSRPNRASLPWSLRTLLRDWMASSCPAPTGGENAPPGEGRPLRVRCLNPCP